MSLRHARFGLRLALLSVTLVVISAANAVPAIPSPAAGSVATYSVEPVAAPTGAKQRLGVLGGLFGGRDTVTIDTSSPGQEWYGVGGALTDASVQLLSGNRPAIRALFDPTDPYGARLNLVRLPLSSTDFSPTLWTWSWDGERAHPAPEAVAAAQLLLTEIAPVVGNDLAVNAVAWSAPAEMKTTGTLRGGRLRQDAETAYGDMLVSQVSALLSSGVPVKWLSLGNEPDHSADYTTMKMSPQQQARLANAVALRLDELGVDLIALDHNWNYRAEVNELLEAAPAAYGAVGWHCYGGHPGQAADLAIVSMITECTGTTDSQQGTFDWDSKNLVAGPAALGNSALWFLNFALDETNGPYDAGSTQRCMACRGIGRITPRGASPEPEFYVAAHLARAARPGSRYLPSTVTDGRISVAAFQRPDGSVGVYAHNGTAFSRSVRFTDGRGSSTTVSVGAGDITNVTLPR